MGLNETLRFTALWIRYLAIGWSTLCIFIGAEKVLWGIDIPSGF